MVTDDIIFHTYLLYILQLHSDGAFGEIWELQGEIVYQIVYVLVFLFAVYVVQVG